MAEPMALKVDGKVHRIEADPDTPLRYTLRDELALRNPRFGCGMAQCGACTVHVDGEPKRSCVLPTSEAEGKAITTIAGLGTPEHPHPLQAAYIAEQVPQCGVCTNGFLMTAAALLAENKNPTDLEIRQALSGLKCRCGTHVSIIKAVKRAAAMMA
jgi:aerobic-type carbon monoxide dehydrogenase small subunit (CoxS/CutS family)